MPFLKSLIEPFCLAAAVLVTAGLLPLQSQAQTARTAIEEYADVVKGAQTITVLGPDLFGEAVNLKDGNTSFSATDVSIPTNSGLPLSIGRSLGVNSRDADRYVDSVADGRFLSVDPVTAYDGDFRFLIGISMPLIVPLDLRIQTGVRLQHVGAERVRVMTDVCSSP